MVIISPEIPCTWLSLPMFGRTCKTAGQPWVELCPPDVKLLVLNCMAYLCFLVSLVYTYLKMELCKYLETPYDSEIVFMASTLCHESTVHLSHGIDDGDGVRHELSLRTEFLPLLEFNICNHQIKIWTWRIANMAWIVMMIFPHKA